MLTKARFHVAVRTQINQFVLYFIVRRNVKFGCSNANTYTNSNVKSGLRLCPYHSFNVHDSTDLMLCRVFCYDLKVVM